MDQQKLNQLIEWQESVNCEYTYWQKTKDGWVKVPDSNQRRTCPYCKVLANTPTMRRWHGGKCWKNPNKEIYD